MSMAVRLLLRCTKAAHSGGQTVVVTTFMGQKKLARSLQ